MENNQKPEWFELADNDQPVSRPLKKKSAPMRSLTFIVAGVLVIPMGAGVALLTHKDNSAIAAETLNLTQDSPAATNSAQVLPVNTIAMPAASRDDDDEEGDDDDYRAPVASLATQNSPTVITSTSKAPAAITPPGSSSASKELILPPTKKSGDDDDEEDDDDDDDDDDEDDDDDDEEDDD